MEIQQNKLDELTGKNPFKIPDGYMERLPEQIMAQIPETSHESPKVVSLLDRIRPWLYLAGVLAGILLFSRLLLSPVSHETDNSGETHAYLQAWISEELMQIISDDDMDYLEYMENQYLDRAFAEEIDFMEE